MSSLRLVGLGKSLLPRARLAARAFGIRDRLLPPCPTDRHTWIPTPAVPASAVH